MKKIFVFGGIVLCSILNINSQNLKEIPRRADVGTFPDGWHKFLLLNASFDVEIIEGRLKKGIITWADGSKYSGSLSGYAFSGRGTYTWPDGRRYEGAFRNHKRHGKGSLIESDNSKWSGKWKHDRKNGKGKEFDASGNVIKEGVWEEGRLLNS